MGAERAKWAIFSLAVAARCLNSLPRLAASAYHMCAHHTIPQHTIAQHTTPYHPIPYHSIPHHTFTIPANKTTPQHTTPTILTCKQYHTITYLASPIYHTSVYQTRPTLVHPDTKPNSAPKHLLAGSSRTCKDKRVEYHHSTVPRKDQPQDSGGWGQYFLRIHFR